MKKVLFVTYYWLPSGKASIHWPLKMIKFLPGNGWQPLVLTVKNEDVFSHRDESLENELDPNVKVCRTNSFEPFSIYKTFTGKKKDEKLVPSETISSANKGLAHRISIWIRMNLFVPDARAGWYFPGVKEGRKFLENENIDAVVSIGPPHTGHLIGMTLSRHFNVPHVPVFIDPWVDIAYYRGFKRSKPTLTLDNYLEKKVLAHAEAAVFVTKTMEEDYRKKYSFLNDKSHVLYWGYDEDKFENLKPGDDNNKEEIILHAGNIFDFQNVPKFWLAVKKEIDNGKNLRLKFIGTVSPGIKNAVKSAGLEKYTEYAGFLPYDEMINELGKASYLLVCSTEKRHVPGKLFEYLRAGKPIIAFGDDNKEVENILSATNAGTIFRYDEDPSTFLHSQDKYHFDKGEVKRYDRKKIAASLSEILHGIT